MNWLNRLAQLSRYDLGRVQRLAELLGSADRAREDTARAMLNAKPELRDEYDARERIEAVIGFLEQRPHAPRGRSGKGLAG